MIERGDPLFATKPTKNPKPNKDETTIERRDPLCAGIPEWLQEFRENLVDDRVPEHANSSHEMPSEPTFKRREDLCKHSVYTHFPKDRNCEIWQRTKITRAPCRRRNGEAVPRAENFGDLITADQKVLSESCESRNNHRYAIVVQDLATQWIQSYPCKTKTSQESQRSLQKFLEPDKKPKVIYTDNSLEFCKACEDLSSNHCTSTRHRSETNGIAERAVRRVNEGTSAVLLQSGLNENWWADSMECHTNLRNVQDLLSDGKLHMRDDLGNHLKDQLFHLVHWLSITLSLRRTSQESINLERKSYLDCSWDTHCTREGIWKGEILVADTEELETMDASEIYSKRLNAKEVIFPKKMDNSFSDRRWTNQTPWRRPGPENTHLGTGPSNSRRRLKRFSWRIRRVLPSPPHDSLPDAGEAIYDFWSTSGNFIYRHHVEPRVKLYSPREESFPIPLRYSDVSRTTHTNLDVKQEKRIDDYWNVDGSRDLSDPWTGFTQFTLLEEKPPEGYMWSGVRLTRKELTSRPDYFCPELWTKL